jgi:PII-like signaling protein
MRATRPAVRLTVYTDQPHRGAGPRPVAEFLRCVAELGVAGASAFVGVGGFGASRRLHEAHRLHGPDKTPITVVVVDDAGMIDDVLRIVRQHLPRAVAVIDDVTVIRYHRDEAGR